MRGGARRAARREREVWRQVVPVLGVAIEMRPCTQWQNFGIETRWMSAMKIDDTNSPLSSRQAMLLMSADEARQYFISEPG